MQTFHCDRCGHLVFFENVLCEACDLTLGYLPDLRTMSSLLPLPDKRWHSLNPEAAGRTYRMCRNYAEENVCNWMLPEDDANEFCLSCRLTEIIPSLNFPLNRLYWYRMEQAKRRLIYTLAALGLVQTDSADFMRGLAFRFLADSEQTGKVITGHDHGVITLNIAEADDSQRERTRARLGEPYRTLLGHFRHEIGHYYWDHLIVSDDRRAAFRALFNDERADYDSSLDLYYEQGPPADWRQHYVSRYASAHPWEDWAETWSQYLHMVDALDTVAACGLELSPARIGDPCLSSRPRPSHDSFGLMLEHWYPLSYVLNNLNRCLGVPDIYQFSLPAPVVNKLRFVHEVVVG